MASSAAHTRGKSQVLSECYGAMGWDLSPEEMRRLAETPETARRIGAAGRDTIDALGIDWGNVIEKLLS